MLGAYLNFKGFTWVLIRRRRLLGAGRLIRFFTVGSVLFSHDASNGHVEFAIRMLQLLTPEP